MRVLLVQPPFHSLRRASLALTNLAGVLRRDGHEVTTYYANLAFARKIGANRYDRIADQLPAHLLAGDLAFSQALTGRASEHDYIGAALAATRIESRETNLATALSDIQESVTHASELVSSVSEHVSGHEYDFVGIAATFQLVPALAIGRAIKALPHPPPIILGGSHCEGPMGLAMHKRFSWIDFVARGEAELLLSQLVSYIESGSPQLDQIQGLVWRQGDRSITNGSRGISPILDDLPPYEFDEWIQQYSAEADIARAIFPMETSRGCWYGAKVQCTFCGLNGENIAFRRKSATRAIQDFDDLERYGARHVHMTDNILDYKYFDSLLPSLTTAKHRFSIFYEAKSNLTNKQVAALSAAGIDFIQPGIESLSTPILKLMKKGVTAIQNVKLLRMVVQHRVGVAWNLLYGFAGEEPSDYAQQAALVESICHLPPPVFGPSRIRVDRFSPMFDDPKEHGLASINPVSPYAHAFAAWDDDDSLFLSEIAYYFDYEYLELRDPEAYIQPLVAAVREWHQLTGKVVLCSVTTSEGMVIVDTRPCSMERNVVLEPATGRMLLSLLDGLSAARFAEVNSVSVAEGERILDHFAERRWTVFLDGRHLSLVVPMDADIPPAMPAALVGPLATVIYQIRLGQMREAIRGDVAQLAFLQKSSASSPATNLK